MPDARRTGSAAGGAPEQGTAAVGDLIDLKIGPVAHGGSCVARHEGRVVFVRHALPGELVQARITEVSQRFWRADAVTVQRAATGRVPPRCELSGPGGCGGCDWQHADLATQRDLKRAVVVEQLTRLGRVDPAQLTGLTVSPVPGDQDGLGWRTRLRFAVDAQGRPGLRRHRSHDIVPVPHCPLAHPAADGLGIGRARWPGTAGVEVVAPGGVGEESLPLVVIEPAATGPAATGPAARADAPPLRSEAAVARRSPGTVALQRLRGRTWVGEQVEVRLPGGQVTLRPFRVTGTGFWQVHPGAAQQLLDVVLELAAPTPGERAIDLYSGVGLFSAGLALAVGEAGHVLAVEADPQAIRDARRSLHDLAQATLIEGRVDRALEGATADAPWSGSADVVVLDPPRAGAGAAVLAGIVALSPRVVVYVACDPAALARDVADLATHGYQLVEVRAFDTFPMTHHVECVAAFTRT